MSKASEYINPVLATLGRTNPMLALKQTGGHFATLAKLDESEKIEIQFHRDPSTNKPYFEIGVVCNSGSESRNAERAAAYEQRFAADIAAKAIQVRRGSSAGNNYLFTEVVQIRGEPGDADDVREAARVAQWFLDHAGRT